MFWGLLFSCLFCSSPATDDEVWFDSGDSWGFDSDTCLPWLVLYDADGAEVSDVIDFGSVNVMATVAMPLVVTNMGDCELTVRDATTDTFQFRVDALDWPVLQPGESAQLVVYFEPTDVGAQTDTLTLHSDDPLQPERTWSLTGTLAPGDVQPDVASVELGTVWLGCQVEAAVEWINGGPGTVTAQELVTVGGSDGLMVASDSLPRELDAGVGFTTLVRYGPLEAETLAATMTLGLDDGAQVSVPISGASQVWAEAEDQWTAGPGASFVLSELPLPDTLVVRVSNVLASGWTYESTTNTLLFESDNSPTAGAPVSATYAVQPPCPE
jgi:hypothetical protein